MERKTRLSQDARDVARIVLYVLGLASGAAALVGLLWLCESVGITM